MSYAVVGVTGNTGSVAADALIAQGKKVRAVVHTSAKGDAWKAKGADVAVADIGDPVALAAALTGAEGAYILLPANMASADFLAEQRRMADALVKAVTESKVPHVVLLSSNGAQHESGNGPIRGLYYIERLLDKVPGLTVSFLRAGYFMENNSSALATLADGIFPTFLKANVTIPQVATYDIGTTAAKLLVEGGKKRQVVELSGPRDYSPNDVAAALGKLSGKKLVVQQAAEEAMVGVLIGFGMTPALAELYREMTHGLNSGHIAWEGKGARVIRGVTPIETVLGKLLAGASK